MGASRNGSTADRGCVTDGPGTCVLVVDDDPDVTAAVRTYLTRIDGVTVEATSDPETALARVEDRRYDCVVSEYEMLGTTGLDVLERACGRHDGVSFVLFTAEWDECAGRRVRDHSGTIVPKGRGGVQEVADYVAAHVGPG